MSAPLTPSKGPIVKNLLSGAWWKAAGLRALRTALVLAAPYAPTVIYDNNWLVVASAALFGGVVSLLTSLKGISETTGTVVPWYYSIFERTTKTAAQALIAAFGTATMFEAVDWAAVPAIVGSSVLGTLFLTVIASLPGTDDPVAPATVPAVTETPEGEEAVVSVPVFTPAVAPEVDLDGPENRVG